MDDNKNLVAAQQIYTGQLLNRMTPYLMQGIMSIFEDVISSRSRGYLKKFQSELENIPKWNQHIIDDEVRRIVKNSNSKSHASVKLDDLVTGHFRLQCPDTVSRVYQNPGRKNKFENSKTICFCS